MSARDSSGPLECVTRTRLRLEPVGESGVECVAEVSTDHEVPDGGIVGFYFGTLLMASMPIVGGRATVRLGEVPAGRSIVRAVYRGEMERDVIFLGSVSPPCEVLPPEGQPVDQSLSMELGRSRGSCYLAAMDVESEGIPESLTVPIRREPKKPEALFQSARRESAFPPPRLQTHPVGGNPFGESADSPAPAFVVRRGGPAYRIAQKEADELFVG